MLNGQGKVELDYIIRGSNDITQVKIAVWLNGVDLCAVIDPRGHFQRIRGTQLIGKVQILEAESWNLKFSLFGTDFLFWSKPKELVARKTVVTFFTDADAGIRRSCPSASPQS
ncbi:hypothetical protein D9M70_617030 [compost metagenome]